MHVFHYNYNVKNFHGSLTTVVRAQNDTTKTANITDTIFEDIFIRFDATHERDRHGHRMTA